MNGFRNLGTDLTRNDDIMMVLECIVRCNVIEETCANFL